MIQLPSRLLEVRTFISLSHSSISASTSSSFTAFLFSVLNRRSSSLSLNCSSPANSENPSSMSSNVSFWSSALLIFSAFIIFFCMIRSSSSTRRDVYRSPSVSPPEDVGP